MVGDCSATDRSKTPRSVGTEPASPLPAALRGGKGESGRAIEFIIEWRAAAGADIMVELQLPTSLPLRCARVKQRVHEARLLRSGVSAMLKPSSLRMLLAW